VQQKYQIQSKHEHFVSTVIAKTVIIRTSSCSHTSFPYILFFISQSFFGHILQMSQTIEKLTSLVGQTFNGKFKVRVLICFSSRRNSQPFDFPSTTLYTSNIREASFRTALPFHFPLNYPKRTPPPVHETSASENYISLLSDWLFFTNTIFFLMELVPCDYNSRQASHLDKKSATLTKTFFTPLIPAIKTEQRIVRVALELGGTGAPRRAGYAIDRRCIVDFSSTELRFRGGDS
jgi:hypothetical protein